MLRWTRPCPLDVAKYVMKKSVLPLALLALASVANADTIFDAIYADAAQTTLRRTALAPDDTFSNYFFAQNHLVGGFFTTESAADLGYIEYQYRNMTNATVSGTVTGTVQIFSTINPNLVTGGASGAAFTDPILTTTFSLDATTAAYGSGIGGFSLDAPVSLQGGKTYGFAIKIASTSIIPTFTNGPTYGTGTVGLAGYNNVNYDFGNTGVIPATAGVSFDFQALNQNVGYALYTVAPVPEPASMMALGVGALVVLRRRKRA